MNHLKKLFIVCAGLIILIYTANAQKIYYVSNGGTWDNWDLYSYDIPGGIETRLTTNSAIDNHPAVSPADPNRIVFSSNRGNGEFDIYVANITDVDNTAIRLTNDSYPGVTGQGAYPDRHPDWHPNGDLIIFTTKNRAIIVPDTVISECSQPAIIRIINGIRYRIYEGMNIIKIDAAGNVLSYTPLDVSTAWNPVNQPGIWVSNQAVYVGHPSFNHAGDKVVFTAAIDGEGKNWEVYMAGFDPVTVSLIPNSLQRITDGPNITSNPIKMTGGASFSLDDSKIYFNSTRTTGGNSQIFSVPSNSVNISVTDATRLTINHGNDYVPEPVENGDLMIASDLGPVQVCGCDGGSVPGPTDDLDVVLLHWTKKSPQGVDSLNRTIVGTDANQDTPLLGDEVSWFCGLKPNLSSCTAIPRIMPVEGLWMEHLSYYLIPPDLLKGYGPPYSNNAQELYQEGWNNIQKSMENVAPAQLQQLFQEISMLWNGFPGYNNTAQLEAWMDSNQQIRTKKYVVPEIMHGIGIGDSCVFTGTASPQGNIVNAELILEQNYPNPFSGITTIIYRLEENDFVIIRVFDIFGKEVTTLVNEEKPKGSYSVSFDPPGSAAGIYYYSMSLKNSIMTRKMVKMHD